MLEEFQDFYGSGGKTEPRERILRAEWVGNDAGRWVKNVRSPLRGEVENVQRIVVGSLDMFTL